MVREVLTDSPVEEMSQMSKGRIICEDALRAGRGLVSVMSTLTALSRHRNLFKSPQAAPHQAQTPVGPNGYIRSVLLEQF